MTNLRKIKFNLQRDPRDDRDHVVAAPPSGLRFPRKGGALQWEAPIRDQQNLGSCGPFALLGAVQNTEIETKGSSDPYAELVLYWFTRFLQGTVDEDSGVNLRTLFRAANKFGICRAPLDLTIRGFKRRPSDAVQRECARSKLEGYANVPQTLDAFKDQLTRGNPIVYGQRLFDGFMSERTIKTGVVQMPTRNEAELGGHAMAIVAYDDDIHVSLGGAFIVRNSWGTRVGAKPDGARSRGYFYIPYAYILDRRLAHDPRVITLSPKRVSFNGADAATVERTLGGRSMSV